MISLCHVAYTCIGSLSLPYHMKNRKQQAHECRQSRIEEWDRVWLGANIATMVAAQEPYGKLEGAALAVKGERIAWIGSSRGGATQGRRARTFRSRNVEADG